MKLTRDRLAEWRKRWDCNCVMDDAEMVDELLAFAEEMLPLRKALQTYLVARETLSGNRQQEYIQATDAFWTLARETDVEVEP